jgi:tRNA(Ile)-lysidine synthase
VQLAGTRATPHLDLQLTVGQVLDRRLQHHDPRPVAVALSGGGDSLALLLAGAEWASRAGRRLLVLTVDHRLRPESADWTRACADTAQRLGLPFRALAWEGDKPLTGLPAAARMARHRLLADAARQAGAGAILMGHTADDGLEARVMRAEGSTTPEPREWSPSPAWPEGRGVFLLRPMLDLRRANIRDWLRMRGEGWIDDPANDDTRYARPRARRALELGATPSGASTRAPAAVLAIACRTDPGGGLEIARAAISAAADAAVARFASAACLCAGGTDRPPAGGKVERLTARLKSDEPFTASLAGARIEADGSQVRFLREAGEVARGGLALLRLQAGETAVWDGRFEVTVQREARIRAAPRSTQPVAIGRDGEFADLEIRPLTYDRLLAACGAVDREPA